MTALEFDPILDGHPGQVQADFRFEILDRTLTRIGDIQPLAADSITATTTGAIKRSLTGMRISQADLNAINPYTDRIKPIYQLGSGAQYPCGVFCFSALPRRVSSFVDTLDATMLDQGFLIDQESEQTFSVPGRGLVIDVVVRILDSIGLPPERRFLPANQDVRTLDPIAWPSTTHKSAILNQISQLAGWLPFYFDNDGNFVLRSPPNIDFDTPVLSYPIQNSTMIVDTVVENDNLLDAPNVYRCVGTGTAAGEIVGTARVPADMPWSVEERGFEIVHTEKMQGIASTPQAQLMASNLAASAGTGFQSVEFDAILDPRHDMFMLVGYGTTTYREVGFSTRIAPGGPMHHSLTLGGFPVAG